MSVGSVSVIPKGLHHLENITKKFPKLPSRVPHPSQHFVQPSDRIRRWNIRPGDKVRLLVGKPREKFVDEKAKAAAGYKVYNVKSVDMLRNWLYLDGLSHKRSATVAPKPAEFDSWDQDRKNRWEEEHNVVPTSRPIHYSNVQLCVEENGAESVFASRISTSGFHFNKRTRMFEWDRYAAKLSGPSSIAPDPEKNQVYLPWPELKLPKTPSPREWDVSVDDLKLQAEAANFLPLDQAQSPAAEDLISITPSSSRAPPPSDQSFSDTYIDSVEDRTHPTVEAAMPLYLSEELSPRFSRAKQTRGWNERRLREAEERAEIGQLAVEEWEAQGRDTGLKEVLAKGTNGLEGVTIRSRTRQEVRDAAMAEYDESLASKRRMVQHARKMGLKWDRHIDDWEDFPEPAVMPGGQLDKASIKRDRKVRRAQRLEQKLSELKLGDERNQVVPPALRAD